MQVLGSCKYGNETSVSVKCRESKSETKSFKRGLYSVEFARESTNVITKARHYVRILQHSSTVRHHIHIR